MPNMSAGTQTLTMERKSIFLTGRKKQTWPDPQSSIDFPCGALGGVPCWTVRGDARRLFAEIEDGIKNLLQDRMDDIADCQHNLETFGWCMYMRGRNESRAEPVLLFECLDRKTREKIVNIVKKSSLWKSIIEKHPALRLASSSRGPQESCSATKISIKSDAVYCDGPPHQLYGVQIYVDSSQDSSSASLRMATLGGLILIDNVLHGMTVAHLFKDKPQTQTHLEKNSDEFIFEDDNEMEDDVSIDITSRGSESPKSVYSTLEQNDSSMETESNSVENYNSLNMTSPMADYVNAELIPPANVSAKTHFGYVKAISDNTLDWAIIPIDGYENLTTSVFVPTEDGDAALNVNKIADPEWISDDIWAITASNGPVTGRLLTVPYYLKSSGSKTFQRTWMAYLEAEVAPGASGTWIITKKTHELVGQVVARQPGSRLAYVVPASLIKNDMESRLECRFSFPILRNDGSSQSFEDLRTVTLLQAAKEGRKGAILRLLENGADIESTDGEYTPLHIAVMEGHEKVVQTLLEKGADTETEVRTYAGMTALHLAVEAGDTEVIRHLLKKGANVHAETVHGSTALHMAIDRGGENVVRELLAGGADVELETRHWGTALHTAARAGHANIIRVLLENGAKTEQKNQYGKIALHLAVEEGCEDVVRELLATGADIESKTAYDESALHLAAAAGHANMVRLLLENGVRPEQKTSFGKTALHLAAENGHENAVRELLAGFADVDCKDILHQTALHLAADAGHANIIRLLLEKYADVMAQNRRGETALDLAFRRGDEVIQELLTNAKAARVAEKGHTRKHRPEKDTSVDFQSKSTRMEYRMGNLSPSSIRKRRKKNQAEKRTKSDVDRASYSPFFSGTIRHRSSYDSDSDIENENDRDPETGSLRSPSLSLSKREDESSYTQTLEKRIQDLEGKLRLLKEESAKNEKNS